MGRKLDLSGLTDNEAEHVLQVVQRDMRLRKKEEERLSELKQELDEEGSRCLLLSRQSCFNRRCCIRCCAPFTFLLNPKRQCRDCLYNVCKACRVYNKRDKAWLCSACQKSRLLKTQSLEWFYTNVKTRFKRFGSAKVLKTLYRKHLVEHSALAELTEGSAYEESICNEGSVCGSDSTFYRQTEEHSMEDTLTVALRVAEEAIDEAISKAEFDSASQEKQNEAHYLRKHRGELVEELAKTIVQKRSHSAFSLLDDSPGLIQETHQTLKKEGGGSAMSAWKSVDRLDNPVLTSPDGNWIALQSAQLSRPSLLTRRKSLVYSALEKESGVVSAYEGMGFDSETKSEPDSSWGTVLQEIHKKMTDSNFNLQDTEDRVSPQLMDHRGSNDNLFSDSEGNWKVNKPVLGRLKRKVPVEIRRPSSLPRTNIIDVNFNVEGAEDESNAAAESAVGKVRRSRKKRNSKKEPAASSPVLDYNKKDNQSEPTSDAVTPETLTSGATTPEPFNPESDITGHGANQMEQELTLKLQQLTGRVSDSSTRDDGLYGLEKEVRATQFSSTEDELDRVGIMDEEKKTGEEEEELAVKVCKLANQVNATQFSSTDDELDGRGEEGEEAIDEVTLWKLQARKAVQAAQVRDLASLVSASQFSSTEDELDRYGENEGEMEHEVNEGGIESSIEMEKVWEGTVGKSQERRESIGDLDVKMFDLREEIEERMNERSEEKVEKATTENVLDCQIKFDVQPEKTKIEEPEEKDCVQERVAEETEDERMEGKVFKETEERQEMQLKTVVGAERREERTEEIIVLYETRVGLENQPEAKWSDKKEGEERQEEEKIRESKQTQEKWETASDSEEEDEEFDRIISSMLMMTLEDMQVEKLKDKGENGGMNRELEEVEADKREKVDSKTDETGGAKERPGENITEQTAGDISTKQESSNATGRNKNEQQEKDTDPLEKPTDMTSEETNEAKQTCKRTEADDKSTRGEMTTEWQMMETQGDAAECESKDTDETLEETKEKHIDDTEQSCTSSLQDGLLSPEEIQNASDMELYKTIEFISSLLEQRYSAVSLRSITTEVLKVLNATEELLQGVEGGDGPRLSTTSLPPNTDPKKLDQQFSRLEENVYVAAGTVYSLEAELSDLEECARGICSATSDMELSFLEEQVASAAAKVQQSELQICDISARIAALKSAGLNVDPQSCFPKTRAIPVMKTRRPNSSPQDLCSTSHTAVP
eukprot:superscaffoldBa00003529_g17145